MLSTIYATRQHAITQLKECEKTLMNLSCKKVLQAIKTIMKQFIIKYGLNPELNKLCDIMEFDNSNGQCTNVRNDGYYETTMLVKFNGVCSLYIVFGNYWSNDYPHSYQSLTQIGDNCAIYNCHQKFGPVRFDLDGKSLYDLKQLSRIDNTKLSHLYRLYLEHHYNITIDELNIFLTVFVSELQFGDFHININDIYDYNSADDYEENKHKYEE